jgi:hypothetical protein
MYNFQDRGGMFLRNAGLSPNYTMLTTQNTTLFDINVTCF